LLLARNILQSRIGRSFFAVKGAENAAEALSINSKKTVLLGFTLSGFIVGIAGGLLSIVLRRIVPECFGLSDLIRQFIMVVLGGLGSITGSIIGAPIIILMPELLRGIQQYQEIVFGSLIVIFVLFAPEGLYGFILKYIPGVSREKLHR
jgi:branched-chain amino acid transport system permease protein